mmetsp:Transcript_40790/g.46349  ORF Transcript_40790/g.46349 Transcript_40790/m.46349 type:complete len:296 (+) Transcript_40790:1-888(+)
MTAADTVVSSIAAAAEITQPDVTMSGDTIEFSVDETKEFTRALRARVDHQTERRTKNNNKMKIQISTTTLKKEDEDEEMLSIKKEEETTSSQQENIGDDTAASTSNNNDKDMLELSKQIKVEEAAEDVYGGIDGTANNSAPIGRGMAGILSMLRHTGEIGTGDGKNKRGHEEMRGRAKDERTYADYEELDLKKVVRINYRNATAKDMEMASRQIKLDYRDEHGRLLTRKEAYRNLCYQFHGHGSSAKSEEKRLRQVEREQAEARLACRQSAGGCFGALKATQKATGKAYVLHKTT